MGRAQKMELEPTNSLAAQRVPAIAQFQAPGDVPTDARAYREELLDSKEWHIVEANVETAAKAVEVSRAAVLAAESEKMSSEEVLDARAMLKSANAALEGARVKRRQVRRKLLRFLRSSCAMLENIETALSVFGCSGLGWSPP